MSGTTDQGLTRAAPSQDASPCGVSTVWRMQRVCECECVCMWESLSHLSLFVQPLEALFDAGHAPLQQVLVTVHQQHVQALGGTNLRVWKCTKHAAAAARQGMPRARECACRPGGHLSCKGRACFCLFWLCLPLDLWTHLCYAAAHLSCTNHPNDLGQVAVQHAGHLRMHDDEAQW